LEPQGHPNFIESKKKRLEKKRTAPLRLASTSWKKDENISIIREKGRKNRQKEKKKKDEICLKSYWSRILG